LERLVAGFFDYLERLLENETVLKMEDLAKSVGEFLAFNRYAILQDRGKVSHALAEKKATAEYDKFKVSQDKFLESDFDKFAKSLIEGSRSD